jgi:hypothetical protein
MGKLIISMAMFNSYVKLPEGNLTNHKRKFTKKEKTQQQRDLQLGGKVFKDTSLWS